jgi:2-oxoglutarate dehydrogenase E2 component (dihydrolipoamide succinyltransferase)
LPLRAQPYNANIAGLPAGAHREHGMAVEEIKVPAVGESITEGTLNRWLKPSGAFVKVDEPLYELGTDKATQEIAAPVAGVLTTKVKEGDTVTVGAVVATIDTSAKPPTAEARGQKSEVRSQKSPAPTIGPMSSTGSTKAPIPSPAAARILAEKNLSPADVPGTGPGGRITKGDALAAADGQANLDRQGGGESRAAQPTPSLTVGVRQSRREPMSQIRKRIATRLVESQKTTATLTTFNEADMSAVMDLRARVNDRFEKKYGVKLGFMSIFVKAAVAALKAFPLVNAKIDGADVVHQDFYDVGVAVTTERGLMVPVIRDADQLDFATIEKRIGELAKKARDGKIAFADLEGGTFTITNGGIFGSMMSTPILNPPQAAILGMHAIQKRAVVVNDQIAIRPMMYLALSYDHRLIDGREAVLFLARIKEHVENPATLMLDV